MLRRVAGLAVAMMMGSSAVVTVAGPAGATTAYSRGPTNARADGGHGGVGPGAPRAVTLAATLPLMASATPPTSPVEMGMRGATIPVWSQDQYDSVEFAAEVATLPADGVNTVVLEPMIFASSGSDPVFPGSTQTASDASLVEAVKVVQAEGLRVVLKPGLNFSDDTSPGNWAPSDNGAAFFANYDPIIVHYAQLAAANGVSVFVVGGETDQLAMSNPTAWRSLVSEVRAVYHGPVTYAATKWFYQQITWWDALDYIGVEAYFDLVPSSQADTSNTNVAQLTAAWTPIMANLKALSDKYGKQILFTEIGYRSVIGTAFQPWNYQSTNPTSDADQTAAFQSVLNALTGKAWFAGMYIWMWDTVGETTAQQVNDYTPHNKPAELALRQAWASAPAAPDQTGSGGPAPPAVSADGGGTAGAPSGVAVPGVAPTSVAAVVAGPGSATVSWMPPTDTSGMTGYTVTSSPGGRTATTAANTVTATVGGLLPGRAYTFTVSPNTTGDQVPSAPSNPIVAVSNLPGPGSSSSAAATSSTAVTAGGVGASVIPDQGIGTATIAPYPSDPVGHLGATGAFFDVLTKAGSSFDGLELRLCGLAAGQILDWWDPSAAAYVPVQPAPSALSSEPGCVQASLSATSSPSLHQLYGTVFSVTDSGGPPLLPESPLAVLLPTTALLLGFVVFGRRRRRMAA